MGRPSKRSRDGREAQNNASTRDGPAPSPRYDSGRVGDGLRAALSRAARPAGFRARAHTGKWRAIYRPRLRAAGLNRPWSGGPSADPSSPCGSVYGPGGPARLNARGRKCRESRDVSRGALRGRPRSAQNSCRGPRGRKLRAGRGGVGWGGGRGSGLNLLGTFRPSVGRSPPASRSCHLTDGVRCELTPANSQGSASPEYHFSGRMFRMLALDRHMRESQRDRHTHSYSAT